MQCPRHDSEHSQEQAMQVYPGRSRNKVSPSCVYDEESKTLTILRQVETLHVGNVDTVHVGDVHHHVSENVQEQEECDESSYREDVADSGEQTGRHMPLRSDGGPTQTNPTNPALTEDVADSGEQPSHHMPLRSDGGPAQTNPTNPALTVVRTEFTDPECYTLADQICPERDFDRLGLCLEFNAPSLSRYRRENTGGGCTGTHKMLVDWKKGFLEHEQREQLANALYKAGLKALAFKVRHGQTLKSLSGPTPDFSFQSGMPSASNFSQPINPPRSLRSVAPTTRPGPEVSLGLNTILPRNTEPSPGNDVQDIELYKLSRQLCSDSYHRLGLSLGFSLDQLDAFKTKSCNNIPNAGLDMLKNVKSHVGHIRKNDFKTFLTTKANLPVPSLVNFC